MKYLDAAASTGHGSGCVVTAASRCVDRGVNDDVMITVTSDIKIPYSKVKYMDNSR